MSGRNPRSPTLGAWWAAVWVLASLAPSSAAAQDPNAALGTGTPLTDLSIEEIAEKIGSEADRLEARIAIMERMHARPAGPDATLWVQLLDVVDEVDPAIAPAVVRAVGMAIKTDQSVRAADIVLDATDGVGGDARAALLALAAHLAHRSDRRRAADIRETLLADHPGSRQAPEAQLLRAEWLLRSSDLEAEGLALLEDLIVTHPEHPVAPEARRLFRENQAPVEDAL